MPEEVVRPVEVAHRAMSGAGAHIAPHRWFFDGWSYVYDLPLVQAATYWPVHDAILQALAPCRRVLDIGCGTGQLAARVRRQLTATRVVGCDFSAGMLRRARARDPAVGWVQGDAGALPFAGGTFDVVISTEAFHWFPDQDAALAEFFRVLKPKGHLLLALVNTPSTVVSDVMHAGSRLLGEPFYWPTMRQIRIRVEAAGFEVLGQRRIFRLPGFLLPPVLTQAVRRARPSRSGR